MPVAKVILYFPGKASTELLLLPQYQRQGDYICQCHLAGVTGVSRSVQRIFEGAESLFGSGES